jgi:hypothetical protein
MACCLKRRHLVSGALVVTAAVFGYQFDQRRQNTKGHFNVITEQWRRSGRPLGQRGPTGL